MSSNRKLESAKLDMLKCFEKSQHAINADDCARDFIKIFDNFYDTHHRKSFRKALISIIRGIVISDTKSLFTRRLLVFSAKMISRIHVYISGNEDDDLLQMEADNEIEHYIFALKKMTLYDQIDSRLNSIYLLSKMITLFKNIQVSFFINILNRFAILAVLDRDSTVRSRCLQAISNLAFRIDYNKKIFQEPFYAAIKVLENDRDKNVRIHALKSLPFNSQTLQLFVIASMDDESQVRRKVIEGLACHSTEINNIIKPDILYTILKNIFYEDEQTNIQVLFNNLLSALITICEDDIVIFSEYINIHQDRKFFETFFYSYFDHLRNKEINLDDSNNFYKLIEKFITDYLDKSTKIINTEQEIFSGLIFMWFMFSSYCRNLNLTRIIKSKEINNEEIEETEASFSEIIDIVDDLLPVLESFCPFVIESLSNIVKCGIIAKQKLILYYIIRLFGIYSVQDSYFKDLITKTFQELLTNYDILTLYPIYLDEIFQVLTSMNENNDESFTKFYNISNAFCSEMKNHKRSDTEIIIFRLQLLESFLKSIHNKSVINNEKMIKRMKSYFDEFIFPLFNSKNDKNDNIIRLCLSSLCGYCLLSQELIQEYSHYFFQYLKTKQMTEHQVNSLGALCDFALKFGFENLHFSFKNSIDLQKDVGDEELNNSKEILVKYLRKYFHSPLHRFDGINELEFTLDYRLFNLSTKAICKLATMKRFWSLEFFSKLIIMFLSDQNIGDSLREFIQGFFLEFNDIFENSDDSEFRQGFTSPYIECYQDVVRKLFSTYNGQILDDAIDKGETFFLSMCTKNYNQLAIRASEMILDPLVSGGLYEKMQIFNVNFLLTMDFTTLDIDTLEVLHETSLSQDVHIVQIFHGKKIRKKSDLIQEALKKLFRKVENFMRFQKREKTESLDCFDHSSSD